MNWVMHLEIYGVLNTSTKLFSSAPNRFGSPPNTDITEICTGQPGALPVLNREAVWMAVKFGGIIKGQIASKSRFERKMHFYPDSPCNFQIVQHHEPIIRGGHVSVNIEDGITGKICKFPIQYVFLAEDVATLKKCDDGMGIDYNSSGRPILGIVSEMHPDNISHQIAYYRAIEAVLKKANIVNFTIPDSLKVNIHRVSQATSEKIVIRNLKIEELHLACECILKLSAGIYLWDAKKQSAILISRHAEIYCAEPDLMPIILETAIELQ